MDGLGRGIGEGRVEGREGSGGNRIRWDGRASE